MPVNYDEEISKLVAHREEISRRAEATVAEYVHVLPAELISLFKQWELKEVNGSPGVVHQLGTAGVRDLKGRLQVFYEALPEMVADRIGRQAFWFHRKPESEATRPALDKATNRESILRRIIGEWAIIMRSAGFALLNGFSSHNGPLEWISRIPELGQADEVERRYWECSREITATEKLISEFRHSKRQGEAQTLWESA